MANLNKVMLIGRLTRDPEIRTFTNGGKVAAFGFAVNNKRKNPQTGQWEDEPVFLDLEAFNRANAGRQLADIVEQYFQKGKQLFIEGHLKLDQWTAQDGQKRQKVKIVVDTFEFLDSKGEGGPREGGRSGSTNAPPSRSMGAPPSSNEYGDQESEPMGAPDAVGEGEGIPF